MPEEMARRATPEKYPAANPFVDRELVTSSIFSKTSFSGVPVFTKAKTSGCAFARILTYVRKKKQI
jgi:hypothetical protein